MNSQNIIISNQILAICFSLFILSACDMPTEPEGAGTAGYARIGDKLKARNDDEGAASFYTRSLAETPQDTATRDKLANLYEAHGDLKAAENQYREALKINPDDPEILRNAGRLLVKEGQMDEAKLLFEHALKINSKDTKALNGLGVTLDYVGNHSAAQQTYKEALEDKPDDIASLNNLAHSYVLTGAYKDAITLLEPHIDDPKATPALRQNLAEAYGLSGMTLDAERLAARDLKPEDIKHNLGFYQSERKKLALIPAYYVYLGSYATRDMAEARAALVRDQFDLESQGFVTEITTEIKNSGGTPTFILIIKGFQSSEKTKLFCEKMVKKDIACKPVNE